MIECRSCGDKKEEKQFYKDKRMKNGLKTACIDCTKKQKKAVANYVKRQNCKKCDRLKPLTSFRLDDGFPINTCKVCERQDKEDKTLIRKERPVKTELDQALNSSIYQGNLKYDQSIYKKGVERIKEVGLIENAIVASHTIITRENGVYVSARIRADGVVFDYMSGRMNNKNEAQTHVNYIFDNAISIAENHILV